MAKTKQKTRTHHAITRPRLRKASAAVKKSYPANVKKPTKDPILEKNFGFFDDMVVYSIV